MELSITIAYATLVVLTGTLWGIISLWAYSSSLPGWGRCLVPAALLAPLLSVPAYEPILFFSIQMAVVLLGAWLWNWGQASKPTRVRFSLQSLLVIVVASALWLSAFTRCEIDALQVWLALLSGGLSLGLTTLLAAWVTEEWRAAKVNAAIFLIALVAIPTGLWETTILNLPEWDRSAVGPFTPGAGYPQTYGCYVAWLIVLELVFLLTSVGLWLTKAARAKEPHRRQGALAFCLLTALPIVWVFWNTPKRREQPAFVAGKDGYTLFCEARDLYLGAPALDDSGPATNRQLRAALGQNAATFAKLEAASEQPFNLERRDFDMNQLLVDAQFIRSAARMYGADAELSIRSGQFERVVYDGLTTMRLAMRVENANLMLGLVANAVHAVGRHQIARVRDRFNLDHIQEIIAGLTEVEAQKPRRDEVLEIDQAWAERQWGWRCQLYNALSDSIGAGSLDPATDAYETVTMRSSVARRLLAVDLAIRAFEQQHQRLPVSLAELRELVPEPMLLDPYLDEQLLKYQVGSDGSDYLLYSVGPDGQDDGGMPILHNAFDGEGDVLLDTACGEIDPPASVTNRTGDGSEAQ